MRGDQWLTKLIHSLNWDAFNYASHAPQLRECNKDLHTCCQPILTLITFMLQYTHIPGYSPSCSDSPIPRGERIEIPTLHDKLLIDQISGSEFSLIISGNQAKGRYSVN